MTPPNDITIGEIVDHLEKVGTMHWRGMVLTYLGSCQLDTAPTGIFTPPDGGRWVLP